MKLQVDWITHNSEFWSILSFLIPLVQRGLSDPIIYMVIATKVWHALAFVQWMLVNTIEEVRKVLICNQIDTRHTLASTIESQSQTF